MRETYINNGVILATRKKNIEEENFIRFNTMPYCAFLKELAQTRNARAVKKANLGLFEDTVKQPTANYFFDGFLQLDIEHQNITDSEIEGATVFIKTPKNSIKIPAAGGGIYSPDFAYIVKTPTFGRICESEGEAK